MSALQLLTASLEYAKAHYKKHNVVCSEADVLRDVFGYSSKAKARVISNFMYSVSEWVTRSDSTHAKALAKMYRDKTVIDFSKKMLIPNKGLPKYLYYTAKYKLFPPTIMAGSKFRRKTVAKFQHWSASNSTEIKPVDTGALWGTSGYVLLRTNAIPKNIVLMNWPVDSAYYKKFRSLADEITQYTNTTNEAASVFANLWSVAGSFSYYVGESETFTCTTETICDVVAVVKPQRSKKVSK